MASTKSKAVFVTLNSLIVLILVSSNSLALDLVGNRQVFLHSEQANWFTAYETCRSQRRQLLTINNEEENSQMLAICAKYQRPYIWLAATDLGHAGEFVWASTGQSVQYTNWGAHEPNNQINNEHCVMLWSGYGWNDTPCDVSYHFFCEETELQRPLTLIGTCGEVPESQTLTCSFNYA